MHDGPRYRADMSIETSTVRVGDLSAYIARPAGGSSSGMLLLPMITGIGAQVLQNPPNHIDSSVVPIKERRRGDDTNRILPCHVTSVLICLTVCPSKR